MNIEDRAVQSRRFWPAADLLRGIALGLVLLATGSSAQDFPTESTGFVVRWNVGAACNHFDMSDGTHWATDHGPLGEAVFSAIKQHALEHRLNPAFGTVTVYSPLGDAYKALPAIVTPTVSCGTGNGIEPFPNAISVYE